jgi:hypothetical protein
LADVIKCLCELLSCSGGCAWDDDNHDHEKFITIKVAPSRIRSQSLFKDGSGKTGMGGRCRKDCIFDCEIKEVAHDIAPYKTKRAASLEELADRYILR